MKGILADNNIKGQVQYLVELMRSPVWLEIWESLNLTVDTFESLGLTDSISDADLWKECQKHELILLTRNRNADTADSLEETIRRYNTVNSLPVVTLPRSDRLTRDRAFADEVVELLLEHLLEIERYRGAGRIWLP